MSAQETIDAMLRACTYREAPFRRTVIRGNRVYYRDAKNRSFFFLVSDSIRKELKARL